MLLTVLGTAALAVVGTEVGLAVPRVNHWIANLGDEPEPLVRATVRYNPGPLTDGFDLVAPDRDALKDKLNGVNSCQSLFDASLSAGAFNLDSTYLLLDVQGNAPNGVTIVGMRAVVRNRAKPENGVHVICFGGGEVGRVGLFFNLDSAHPAALRVGQSGPPRGLYFAKKVVHLQPDEPFPFSITASAARSAVEWELKLDLLVNGEQRTETVEAPQGGPFRTSGRLSIETDEEYLGQVTLDPLTRPNKLDTSRIDRPSSIVGD